MNSITYIQNKDDLIKAQNLNNVAFFNFEVVSFYGMAIIEEFLNLAKELKVKTAIECRDNNYFILESYRLSFDFIISKNQCIIEKPFNIINGSVFFNSLEELIKKLETGKNK